jgi:hypothetical protein
MSKQPINDTFKKQQGRLVRATFKKAFISAVHTNQNTVDVAFAENPLTIVRNVPVANTITIANLAAGQRCRIDIFDETNPTDMVLAYTY